MRIAVGPLTRRPELIVLVVAVLATPLFPHRSSLGIYGIGVVEGCLLALYAVAVVLVFRSSRVLNVAQVSVAVLASTLFASMVTYQPLARLFRATCAGSCFTGSPPGWFSPFNYAVSALFSIALAVAVSWLTYTFVIRYLESAPRLVGTVATIFLVSVLGVLAGKVPGWLSSQAQKEAAVAVGAPAPPLHLSLHIGGVTFSSAAILVVVVTAVVVPGIAAYLRWSSTGVAIRASAEAPQAMSALGIDVRRVTAQVWLLAGLLAGLAGVASTMGSAPPPAGASVNAPILVRVLGAAVLARFVSLPVAAGAGLAFGVLDQTTLFGFGSGQPLDAGLFVLLAVALLLQRETRGRVDLALAGAWRTAREIRPIPRELRNLPVVRSWTRNSALAGIAILVAAPWLLSPSQTSLASYALLATLIFLSLIVLTGWAGQISLGQLAFAAVGAWVTAVTHLPVLVALPVAMLAGAAVAVVVGIPALKLRGLQLAVITLVFNLSVTTYLLSSHYLGRHLPASLGRPSGLGLRLDDERTFYYVAAVLVALVYVAVVGIRRSALGRALLAARDNEVTAQSFGIAPTRVRLVAFALSGAIAGLAGSMLAYQEHAVITDTFSADHSVLFFLYAVIGGLGSVSAALVAFGYFAIVTVFGLPAALTQLLTGAGGLLLLLLSRGGLSDVVYAGRDALLRVAARRNRIAVPSLGVDPASVAAARQLAIAPKARPGGGTVFVLPRYRLDADLPAATASIGDGDG